MEIFRGAWVSSRSEFFVAGRVRCAKVSMRSACGERYAVVCDERVVGSCWLSAERAVGGGCE